MIFRIASNFLRECYINWVNNANISIYSLVGVHTYMQVRSQWVCGGKVFPLCKGYGPATKFPFLELHTLIQSSRCDRMLTCVDLARGWQ